MTNNPNYQAESGTEGLELGLKERVEQVIRKFEKDVLKIEDEARRKAFEDLVRGLATLGITVAVVGGAIYLLNKSQAHVIGNEMNNLKGKTRMATADDIKEILKQHPNVTIPGIVNPHNIDHWKKFSRHIPKIRGRLR